MNVGTATVDSRYELPVDLADVESMTAAARGMYSPGLSKGIDRLQHNYNRVLGMKAGVDGIGNVDWNAVNQAIVTGSQAVLPILVAQTPGTVYTTNPQTGQVMISTAPVGGSPVLPYGYGYGAGGNVQVAANTPFGSFAAGDIDWGVVGMVGIGLVVLMMGMGKGR